MTHTINHCPNLAKQHASSEVEDLKCHRQTGFQIATYQSEAECVTLRTVKLRRILP